MHRIRIRLVMLIAIPLFITTILAGENYWAAIPHPPPSQILVFNPNMKVGIISIPFTWSDETIILSFENRCDIKDKKIGLTVSVFQQSIGIEELNSEMQSLIDDSEGGFTLIEKYDNGLLLLADARIILSAFVTRGSRTVVFLDNSDPVALKIETVKQLRRDILNINETVPSKK